MHETSRPTAPGTGGAPDDGPLTAERAVALVEQLATALGAPRAQDAGLAAGRVGYMAPEHFLHRPVGPPTDVYAMACILFELLTGSPPFTGDSATVIDGHLHGAVPPLRSRRPDLPPALDSVIAAGTAKDPHARYPTVGAFAAAARAALAAPVIPTQAAWTPVAPATRWAPVFAPPTQVAYPPSPPPPPAPAPARRSRLPIVAAVTAAVLLAAVVGVGTTFAIRAVTAGGVGSGVRSTAAPVAVPSSAASTAAATSVVGTWSGTYSCAQGETGLRLAVDGSDATLSATFRFFAVPQNPSVPDGAFSMTGSQSGSDVTLRGSTWISQPTGYILVDLVGQVSDDGTTFDGQVKTAAATCTTFHLTRAGSSS